MVDLGVCDSWWFDEGGEDSEIEFFYNSNFRKPGRLAVSLMQSERDPAKYYVKCAAGPVNDVVLGMVYG